MISIKKIATVGIAAGLLATSAMPAFANGRHHRGSDDDLTVAQSNSAFVGNLVVTRADTGDNYIGGGSNHSRGHRSGGSNSKIVTGDASADALVTTEANSNSASVAGCGCFDDVSIAQSNEALVLNGVFTTADTGDNSISGGSNGGHHGSRRANVIRTGDAMSVATVGTLVNSNVVVVE